MATKRRLMWELLNFGLQCHMSKSCPPEQAPPGVSKPCRGTQRRLSPSGARGYRDYSVEADPVHGTYCLIWFPTGKSPYVLPRTFAVKTVDPEKIAQGSKRDKFARLLFLHFATMRVPNCYM
jgi:hypothetical protein